MKPDSFKVSEVGALPTYKLDPGDKLQEGDYQLVGETFKTINPRQIGRNVPRGGSYIRMISNGVTKIQEERHLQKEKGYDVEHDLQHNDRELPKAAVCILLYHLPGDHPMTTDHSWFRALPMWIQKLGDDLSLQYERALRVAGAFCAAELDRIENSE
jgi:hypothetical protein